MSPHRTSRASWRATWCLALAFAAAPAGAFQPPDATIEDIDRLAAPTPKADAERIEAALMRSPAWTTWSATHPAWRVTWNPRTRTPHRMWGPGARLAAAPTATTIEPLCREFLARHAALFGTRDTALRLAAADHRLGRWYVVFQQVENGVPVHGGRVDLRIGANGSVVLVGSDVHRDIDVPQHAAIDVATARAAAAAGVPQAPTEATESLLLVPQSTPQETSFRLVWEVVFRTTEPPGHFRAWVDARDGSLLRRTNELRYLDLSGNVTAEVESTTVGDPYETRPLRDTRFDFGPGFVEFTFTDPDGAFLATTTATDSLDVRVRLSGRFARVRNRSLGDAIPTILARMLPGTGRDFAWTDSNSRASERDAYYFTLAGHEAIKVLDPAFTGLDYVMPVVVDITDRDCNAFYDGFGINFLAESARCANTARIADVVYHEYGHAITDHVYRPFAPSGAMHEGFSDYFAATLTNQPLIGRGFRGPGTSIRTVDNTRTFPDDVVGEVHQDGLIIAGALWDLRQAIGAAGTDSLFHYARYGRADNFDDYLLDVLVTDDDNADIYDGTPRFNAIVGSFLAHGIGDYRVQIGHTPEEDTEDPAKPLVIEATILSIFALEPPSLALHWARRGEAWATLPLAAVPGGGSRDYAATIPAQPLDTTIDYYITAADTAGHTAVAPPEGEAEPYSFRIGTDTTPPVIVHAPLTDRPLDAPAWRVDATVTDNLDRDLARVVVEWSRNAPTLDQTTVLVPTAGDAWLGGLSPAGANLGDTVYYRIVATDSATVPNLASSPDKGAHTFQVVAGFARDLEADDAGFVPGGDWEWGVPALGPPAYSGASVWATGLTGSYTDNSESALELGSIDLSTWDQAALAFRSWFESEPFFDGGQVQASTDGGLSWTTIVPSGGYPFDLVFALGGPGWSGDLSGWRLVEFDLSQFVGAPVQLRLQFSSDSGVVDRGWFVDDIEVVARQVLSVPLALRAQSGEDSQVPLTWSAPAGIDPNAPGTPLDGYHVYRASSLDLGDAVRLTTSPLDATATTFTDLTAVNGTTYAYAVTALYASGESPRSAATLGQAYVAGFASDAPTLYVPVPQGGAADTSITFTNTGTGVLQMNVFLGGVDDASIDAVRIAYEVPGGPGAGVAKPALPRTDAARTDGARTDGAPLATQRSRAAILADWEKSSKRVSWAGERGATKPAATSRVTGGRPNWLQLHTDPLEGTTPDWSVLSAAEDGGNVVFQLRGHTPWGNPLAGFNTILAFDVDRNRGSGDDQGADLYVLIGPFALAQLGAPAILVTPDQQVLGVPPVQHFPNGADSLEVGFSANLLGGAGNQIYVSVAALAPNMQTFIDGMPNSSPTAAWLVPQALHVSVPAEQPTALVLEFPGLVPIGRYRGKIFLETNAPETPVATIPVTYDFGVTAVEIHDLVAAQDGSDVVVDWRTGMESEVAAFRVHRSMDGGPFVPLAPDVVPETDRAYTFRDREAPHGRATYRIGEVALDGRVTLHGGVQIIVGPNVPRATFLDPAAPNPFNPSTTLRFGIATPGPARLAVYDIRGRLVRTLWRAPHAEPGFQRAVWDGRDDAGRGVASGVYVARLEAAGLRRTQRLMLVK